MAMFTTTSHHLPPSCSYSESVNLDLVLSVLGKVLRFNTLIIGSGTLVFLASQICLLATLTHLFSYFGKWNFYLCLLVNGYCKAKSIVGTVTYTTLIISDNPQDAKKLLHQM